MLIKKIAGIAFAVAFLMALVIFASIGRSYMPLSTAKIIFMFSGAIGMILNFFSFQTGKNNPIYNFLFWGGSIILFVGLIFLQFHYPFGEYIIIGGLLVLGISFIVPKNESETNPDNDILDN